MDAFAALSCAIAAIVIVATLSLLLFLVGATGGFGPFFPPRGPTPKSARLLNFGMAFRFTNDVNSGVSLRS